MATISNISGVSHPRLAGQVRQTTGPDPNSSARKAAQETAGPQRSRDSETQTAVNNLDKGQVQDLAAELQQALDRAASEPHSVSFRRDEETEDFVIEIYDPEGELVKQIPPEKVLNLRQKLAELSGMVLDHKS